MLKKQRDLVREKAREELNMCVAAYGTLDRRTLEISQKLDDLIVQDMKDMKERLEIKRILCKGFN